ncbi:putative reverse transcriptase domain-containing protein [Tanacetum coccineum]
MVTRRVAEEMEAREAARTLEPLNENGDEQEGENGGNGNGGNGGNGNGGNGENGNGNRNGNHGMNYGGFMPVARECTFQDFLKCKPHNFSGTEGVVGLTRWFEKMETVFNISNCPSKYQVKYATCTLQDSALTWWNSHKRTIGVDAAYAMNWAGLMRLMTEVYCPRNEIQKMETELWNLTVKGNDLTAYTQRFQELILLCTRMVPDEEDRVERFIGGLPDNIQGNVIAANPARLQDAVRIANQLMDKKLQGYAARSAENKRRMESNPRDNRGQQPPFKRQNISGQNVARAYTAGNNERKGEPQLEISRVLVVMSVGNRDISGRIVLTRVETRLENKLEVTKLQQRPTPLVKEEQTLIPTLSRHEGPLKLSEFNEEEELYAKFSKRELFWLSKYNFLVHLDDIARHSLDTSPAKIEAIKDWASPKTPTEIRQFLEGSENFVVYCDASHKGLGAVLMQREKSGDTTFNGTKVRVFTDHKSLQHILIPEGAEYEAKTLVRNSWLLRLLRSDITSESANRVANAQRIEERSKPLFEFEPWYAGTPGEVLSSPGNVKTKCKRNTRTFSPTLHPLQRLRPKLLRTKAS